MLYPVMRSNRVAKVGSGRSTSTSATTSQPAQSMSRPQAADTSGTEDVHAAFEYARTALDNVATMNSVGQSSTEGQSAEVQQAGSAYAQVEQQAGQALDITAQCSQPPRDRHRLSRSNSAAGNRGTAYFKPSRKTCSLLGQSFTSCGNGSLRPNPWPPCSVLVKSHGTFASWHASAYAMELGASLSSPAT